MSAFYIYINELSGFGGICAVANAAFCLLSSAKLSRSSDFRSLYVGHRRGIIQRTEDCFFTECRMNVNNKDLTPEFLTP